MMDDEIADLMAHDLAQRGVRLIAGASVDRVTRVDGRLRVRLSTGAAWTPPPYCSTAGRVPSTEGLGLADAGVQVGHGRILVDRYFRTTASGVFAAGDVVRRRPGLARPAARSGGRRSRVRPDLRRPRGCELETTDRGVIAGRGGRLKLIFRADDHRLLGVHCIGDLASEIVALGHGLLRLGDPVA